MLISTDYVRRVLLTINIAIAILLVIPAMGIEDDRKVRPAKAMFEKVRFPVAAEAPYEESLVSNQDTLLAGQDTEAPTITGRFQDVETIFRWLIAQGGQILILNESHQPFASVTPNGSLIPLNDAISEGITRDVSGEIDLFVGDGHREWNEKAIAIWPISIWDQITANIRAKSLKTAHLIYYVSRGDLHVAIARGTSLDGDKKLNLGEFVISDTTL